MRRKFIILMLVMAAIGLVMASQGFSESFWHCCLHPKDCGTGTWIQQVSDCVMAVIDSLINLIVA